MAHEQARSLDTTREGKQFVGDLRCSSLSVCLASKHSGAVNNSVPRFPIRLSQLDIKKYLRQGVSPTYDASTRRNHSTSAAVSSSQVDASVLTRTLAALMIQARAETDSLRVDVGRAAGVGVAPACQGCDLVIVHGSEALDTDLLSPEGFGLSPTEVLSVFVDTVPQVICWAKLGRGYHWIVLGSKPNRGGRQERLDAVLDLAHSFDMSFEGIIVQQHCPRMAFQEIFVHAMMQMSVLSMFADRAVIAGLQRLRLQALACPTVAEHNPRSCRNIRIIILSYRIEVSPRVR